MNRHGERDLRLVPAPVRVLYLAVPPEPPRVTVLRLDLCPNGGLASGKARLADIVSAAGAARVPSEAGVQVARLEAVRAYVSAFGGDLRSGRCGHGTYFQVEHMSRARLGAMWQGEGLYPLEGRGDGQKLAPE